MSLLAIVTGCTGDADPRAPTNQSSTRAVSKSAPRETHPVAALVSAAADRTRIRVDWRLGADVSEYAEVALFLGPDRVGLLKEPPREIDLAVGHALVTGISEPGDWFAALGTRTSPDCDWTASGPTLRVRLREPLYVDVGRDSRGDGSSPSAPLDDLRLALLLAAAEGGGNVWVRGGDVNSADLPLFTGVQLCGGFGPDFDLVTRDPEGLPTRIRGSGNALFTTERGGAGPAVLDGVTLLSHGPTQTGIEISDKKAELRRVEVAGCERGIKLRASPSGPAVAVLLTGVRSRGNALQGLSVEGAFDLVIESSEFDSNTNEGADFNHLVAPDGGSAALFVRGSRFSRNGSEGLDLHLGAPRESKSGAGRFQITIQDCDFEANGFDGLRVDVDYERTPGWSAEIVVRGSTAWANGAAGLHFDLDANCTAFAYRVACAQNRDAGLWVSSESHAGMCTVARSSFQGNVGPGILATLGNVAVSAVECYLAENQAGGFVSSVVTSIALDSLVFRQPHAWVGVIAHECLERTVSGLEPIENRGAPYVSFSEISGDDPTRAGLAVLDAVRNAERPRAPCAWGLAGEPFAPWLGASGADFGSQSPTGIRGREDPIPAELFYVAATQPAWSTGLVQAAAIDIEFAGGHPRMGFDPEAVELCDPDGRDVSVRASVVGTRLRVERPDPVWPNRHVLEIDRRLLSARGEALTVPFAIPVGR